MMDQMPTPQRLLDQSRADDLDWTVSLKMLLDAMVNIAGAKRVAILVDRGALTLQIVGEEADGIAQPISFLMWSTEVDFAYLAAQLADEVTIDSHVGDRREVLVANWAEMAAEDRWKARRPDELPMELDGTTRFIFRQMVQTIPDIESLQQSASDAKQQLGLQVDVEVCDTQSE